MYKKPKSVYTSNQGIIAEATKKQRNEMHQWANTRQDWLRQLSEAELLQKPPQTRIRVISLAATTMEVWKQLGVDRNES